LDNRLFENHTILMLYRNIFHLSISLVVKGHKEVVEVLLANGAYIEARIKRNGYTPLHYAAYCGMPEMVELLLSKGANIKAGNRWGAKPMHVAVGYDRSRVVKLLLSKGANIQAKCACQEQ